MSALSHETGTVDSDGLRLFFRKFGRPGKTPILIAHGLSYFSYDWIEASSALAIDREVVAVDTRGFGDSDWSPRRDYAVPTLARDLLAVLDHRGWREAILIGHSMSGRSTSLCAADHPQRIRGLVLVDYTPENSRAGGERVMNQIAAQPDVFESVDAAMRYFNVDPASVAGIAKRPRFEAYLRPADGGFQLKRDLYFRDQFRRQKETGEKPQLGVDMWQVISRVACPILSLRGARSDMYAPETVTKMKAANPKIQVVEVDAGHNVAVDNLAGFLLAVHPFIESLESYHV